MLSKQSLQINFIISEQKFPVPSCLRLIRIHAILFPFFSFLSTMDLQFVNFIIFANISLIEFSFKSLPRMTVYLQNLLDPYTICRLPFQDYFISKTLSLVRQAPRTNSALPKANLPSWILQTRSHTF